MVPEYLQPVTINKDGTRVVVETKYANGERCQMIWVREGEGWQMSLCHPGLPPMHLNGEAARVLGYALRTQASI